MIELYIFIYRSNKRIYVCVLRMRLTESEALTIQSQRELFVRPLIFRLLLTFLSLKAFSVTRRAF